MSPEEAEVLQRAIELVDMWDGVRTPTMASTTLRLYKAVGALKRARALKAKGVGC